MYNFYKLYISGGITKTSLVTQSKAKSLFINNMTTEAQEA